MAERAWIDVRSIGDELARTEYQLELALANAATLAGQMSLQRLEAYARMIVSERYCPAKAGFLARASEAELEHRAAAHCAAAPPTNDGVTDVTTPLTESCKAAFAVPCP